MSAPLTYLTSSGARASAILPLTWGVLFISIAVCVIVGALLLIAILRKRPVEGVGGDPRGLMRGGGSGLASVYIGVGLSTLVLLATTVWTMKTLAEIVSPPREAKLTIEVTGHQFWWEARYLSAEPAQIFTTANEIHIPAGEPVRFRLIGSDVIHSFWVPALTGKTDVIPGQTNITWLQADRPGIYRGQCTEYCGQQHANMAFFVVAEPSEQFEAWRGKQIAPASVDAPQVAAVLPAFQQHCAVCHTVRGTSAGGKVGPDLTHLMSRGTIAAGTLPNTPGHLSGWIADPQGIKPGNLMPQIDLSGSDLDAIRSFIGTLG
ncbi:MAG: cytochrome c oxidase subunit II [Beijerinckiaceae bacterium]